MVKSCEIYPLVAGSALLSIPGTSMALGFDLSDSA